MSLSHAMIGVLSQNDNFYFVEGAFVKGIEYEFGRWVYWVFTAVLLFDKLS